MVVCVVTSNLKRAYTPGNVTLNKGEANLSKKSVVNISQIHTANKSDLKDRIGSLSLGRTTEIIEGLKLLIDPLDSESGYLNSIIYAKMGKEKESMKIIRKIVKNGFSFNRILAGPRDLYGDFYNYLYFQRFYKNLKIKLIQGPMVGNVTLKSTSIWVRSYKEVPVSIKYSKNPIRNPLTFLKTFLTRCTFFISLTSSLVHGNLIPNFL